MHKNKFIYIIYFQWLIKKKMWKKIKRKHKMEQKVYTQQIKVARKNVLKI